MMGLRTVPKEDLQSSSAELVYGQPLRVSRNFIPISLAPWSATQQRTMLLDNGRVFTPVPASPHGLLQFHIPTRLRSEEYGFIRHDPHREPLQSPYDGLLPVLEIEDKAFIVDICSTWHVQWHRARFSGLP